MAIRTIAHLGAPRVMTGDTQLNLPAVTVGGVSIDRLAELQAALDANPDAPPGTTIAIFEKEGHRQAALRENSLMVVPRTLRGVDEASDNVDPLEATALSVRTQLQLEETGHVEAFDLFQDDWENPPQRPVDLDEHGFIDFTDDGAEPSVVAAPTSEQVYAVAAPEFAERACELFARATDYYRAATKGPIPIQWFARMIEADDVLAKLKTVPPYDIANHVRVLFNYELLPGLMKCFDRMAPQRVAHAPINAIEQDAHTRILGVDGLLANASSLLATTAVPDAKGVSLRTKVGDVVTVEVSPGLRVSIELYRNLRKKFTSERQPERPIADASSPENQPLATVDKWVKAGLKPFDPAHSPMGPAAPVTLFGTELMLTFSSPLFSVPGTTRAQNEGYRAMVLANDVGDGVVRGEAFNVIRREQGGMRQADVHPDKTPREKFPHCQMLLLDPRFGKPVEDGTTPTPATNISLKHQYAITDDMTRADAMCMFVIVNALTAALQKA